MTTGYSHTSAASYIARVWADELVGQISSYIEIPALSPAFDSDWANQGHIADAVDHVVTWIEGRPIAGMSVQVHSLPGRTPVILVEVEAFSPPTDLGPAESDPADRAMPGSAGETILLYGHLDKQPEMSGWREGFGPWNPVRVGDRLYGRGGADDGYAAFASLTAIEAVQASGGSHNRCILVVEASEESGSPDLPAHIDALRGRLGDVALVICLDSGCATFDTLWLTTSLRGLAGGTLSIDIVEEGLHSGSASGIVPSTFRILRQLLDRIENSETGAILVEGANVEIPQHRIDEVKKVARELGSSALERMPFIPGATPVIDDVAELLLNRTWRPGLAITGADGLPSTSDAGNVLRPTTSVKVSLRLPPSADESSVLKVMANMLTQIPPYGAKVQFTGKESGPGWDAPPLEAWLSEALEESSQLSFGQPMQLHGEGGSIPFMGMLGEKFPRAQFVITGVLGPESNAHGPNEFLDVAYAEKLTGCIANVLVKQQLPH